MAASADIWTEHDKLTPLLTWSVVLHGLLFASIVLWAVYGNRSGESWGSGGTGGGDAMSVNIVSNIPLPRPTVPTENIVANESKGLSQSLPREQEKETPEAIPIPDRQAKRRPREMPHSTTQEKPQPAEQASNVVPYGQGGPISGPYGIFNAGAAKGGLSFGGGGGDFGSRYGWYVNAVRQRISDNWLRYEIDPRISNARRVYVRFEIDRSGRPISVQLAQSSGVPSLDQSAIRAVQRVDSFPPLPPDFSGSKVAVEFWFDYQR